MVQKNLTEGAIPHPDSTVSSFVTMSLGVVTLFPETGREKTFLFEYADQALFEAKRSGRNRINVYTSGLKKPGQ